jgi:hypothetical protein
MLDNNTKVYYSLFLEEKIAELEADEKVQQIVVEEDQGAIDENRVPYLPLSKQTFDTSTNTLLSGILYGGEAVGYETLQVTELATSKLTVPAVAKYALIVVEADATTSKPEKALRYKMSMNSVATIEEGMILGDLGVLEVKGLRNLSNFNAIGIEVGKVHKLNIEYYG